MYSFKNDYSEGAHPAILRTLTETNLEQFEGYGEDQYTVCAAELLKQKMDCPAAVVHFIPGGTQTNLIALSAFLRPHEAAISANTGHVLVHEAGAIEATGHKVISVESSDGKLTPKHIAAVIGAHTDEHMVKPRLVYLSNPTEIGTIYYKRELTAISQFCREKDLYLYVDGARLGNAICAAGNDLELADFPRLTDAFYIGGTKNGAMIGEALVISRAELQTDFRYHMKQKGALLAKGKLLGIQFLELFRDDLYFELAGNANSMAEILRNALCEAGYPFLVDSPTNQLFPILPDRLIERLQKNYSFHIWSKWDADHTVIRLVTSWATDEAAVRRFTEELRN